MASSDDRPSMVSLGIEYVQADGRKGRRRVERKNSGATASGCWRASRPATQEKGGERWMNTSAVATCRNPVDTESLTCRRGAMGDLGGR